jgi:hypothetical protein
MEGISPFDSFPDYSSIVAEEFGRRFVLEDGEVKVHSEMTRGFAWNCRIFVSCSIVCIEDNAFYDSDTSVSEVVFCENCCLSVIGASAFSKSCLRGMFIPKSVNVVGENCFRECKFLVEVLFEEGCQLKLLPKGCFQRSSLRRIFVPRSIESIEKGCFLRCSELWCAFFAFDCAVKAIGELAFHSSGLRKIDVPVSVESLGKYCFYQCRSLINIAFPNE